MSEVLSATNISFILQGLWLTLYISFIAIILSTIFGTILAVMRNGKIAGELQKDEITEQNMIELSMGVNK